MIFWICDNVSPHLLRCSQKNTTVSVSDQSTQGWRRIRYSEHLHIYRPKSPSISIAQNNDIPVQKSQRCDEPLQLSEHLGIVINFLHAFKTNNTSSSVHCSFSLLPSTPKSTTTSVRDNDRVQSRLCYLLKSHSISISNNNTHFPPSFTISIKSKSPPLKPLLNHELSNNILPLLTRKSNPDIINTPLNDPSLLPIRDTNPIQT